MKRNSLLHVCEVVCASFSKHSDLKIALKALPLAVFAMFSTIVNAQTTFSWRNDQNPTSGQWNVTNYWWNGSAAQLPGGGEILFLDGNVGTTMTNDLPSTNRHKITFGATNAAARTIGGSSTNTFFEFGATWPRIQNDATNITHTINFPMAASTNAGFNLELVSNTGPLVFGGTLNNNGRTIQVYGNNTAIDGTNRFVRLGGVVSGSGALNVSQFGVAKLNAAHTYTGQTQIDNGELWIESSGSIASGSSIFVGNGGQLTNVAKLWLSNSTGGTTFTNAVTINNGNTTTRYLGGLNTSGTHTFSGNITNNSTTGGLYLSAVNVGGTTAFSGVISGTGAPVLTDGIGTVTISGTSANTYTGATTIGASLTVLNKTAGIAAIPSATTVNTGVTLRTDAANQWGTGAVPLVTINGSGTFNLNGNNQKVALASSSSTAAVTLGAGTLNIDNTGTDTYAGTITGTGSINKTNTGTEVLSNTGNAYTGTTTVTGGTLRLGAANVIPNASNIILAGGTLSTGATTGFAEVMGTLQVTANSTINFGTGFHNVEFANSSAVSWTAGANLIVTGWAGTYGGGTAGTAGRFLVGFPNAGGLTASQLARIYFFNGTNYFTATQLSNGEVVPNGDIAMFWGATATAAWNITTGTRWDINPTSTTFANNWATNRAAVFNVANSAITGVTTNVTAITANESVTVTAGGTLNFGVGGGGVAPIFVASGKILNLAGQGISTTAGYTKNGPGTLQLNGTAFTQGVTLNDGMIAASGINAMGGGAGNYLQINGGTIAGTATRNLAGKFPAGIFVGGDFTLGSSTAPAAVAAALTFDNTIDLGSFTNRTITLGGTGLITWNGAISGTGTNLIIASSVASTLLFGAANTYTANTTINGGTLRCGIAGALPLSTNVTLANTAGVTLNLNNFSQTISSISGGGTTGGNVSLGTATLTLEQTTNTSYNGIISGTGALVKSGAGTLILGGDNTYTGTTNINGGTLQLGAAERIANSSNITLNGGTLATGGFSETVDTLVLSTSSVISLGAGAHNLTFASSSGVAWSSSSIATLIINGWTGAAGSSGTAGKIFFGNATGTLTAAQLAQISFTGYSLGATLLSTGELVPAVPVTPSAPSITGFTPSSGQVGTLVTITGTNLGNPTAFSIGGIAAISVSNSGTTLVGLVMPGATTGAVTVTTAQGTASGGGNFTVTPTPFPTTQQGTALIGTGATGAARQGQSVALSADGNTALVGGVNDNSNAGAAWVYTRSGSTWAQQGTKLVGTGGIVAAQGSAVALSADGNTAAVGGSQDNGNVGAVWVFVRSGSTWIQQGSKLVGTGAVGSALQGSALALSADGNTLLSGGYFDNTQVGAVWVFTRSLGFWTQQGSKLVGTGATGSSYQGISVALSAVGNTAMVGGSNDNTGVGAAWVYTRSGSTWTQQGSKLTGTGNTGSANVGRSVSLAADGNTALIGGPADNSSRGATWVFTRSGTTWSQQGTKLVGTGFTGSPSQGVSTGLSADGNTAIIGGWFDNSQAGAVWLYTRSGTTWTQQGNKLVGTGATGAAQQGFAVAMASNGFTAIVGGPNDNTSAGAAWIYVLAPPTITTTVAASSITNTTASSGGQGITGAALTAKGVVYSLGSVTTTPTLSNSVLTDGTTTTANFTSNITGLSPQRQYYVRAYATNAAGTAYASAINFWTLSNPPASQASSLSATASASGQLTVSWTAATWPGFNANNAGYALIYSSATPTLSSTNGTAPAAGVGTLVTVLSVLPTEPATSQIITGLTPGTTYNFLLVPFTWNGTNVETYNYLTASAPTTSATAVGNPTITTTTAISSITNNSASSGGSGISANGGTISAKGVVWNTATAPTTANSSTNDGTGTASFSSSLTSLSAQTLYYVRSYATNQVATAYGNELSFYTLSNEPTAAATSFAAAANGSSQIDLSWTAATFPGAGATNSGYIILRRSDSTNPTTTSVTDAVAPASLSLPSGTTLVTTITSGATTSYNNTGLAASSQYNYIIIPFTWNGTNAATYNYYLTSAPTANATTAAGLPTVDVTTAASSITNNSASSGGSSLAEGGSAITAKGMAYNTSTLPTISNSTTNDGSGTTNFSSSLSSLSAQTLYYARAYVTNSSGTGYGNEITFRTLSNPATAQASSLSASNSASGELTLSWTGATFPSSGATQGGYALVYSTGTPTLTSTNGAAPAVGVGTLVTITPTNLPTAPTTSYVLSGLTGGTTYNFLLVPFTWDGTNATTYYYLTTSAPTTTGTAVTNGSVTTTAASAITNTTASSGGSAINAGGGTISAKGVVWNTSTAPTTANNSTNDGTGTSSFSSSLTSLNAQTLYYYRAYATNNVGTAYGSESSFYTLSNAPTIQASGLSASATSSSNINLNWSAAAFPASGATTTGYVLLRATSPNTPSLGNGNGATPTAGANTTIVSSSIAGASSSASSGTLAAATTYNYLLVPFTWDGVNAATYNYLTSSAPTASATTLATSPSAQPTTLVFSAVTASTITASWTTATGSPAGYIVLRSTASPDTDPVAGTTYSAGNTLGNATVVYVGSAVTTGSQTGLVDGTTYYYEVFSYNGSGSTINYLTTSPLSGTQATTAISAPVATAATSAASASFTANWGAVSGASSYLLDVSANPCFASFGSSSTAAEGFAGGTTAPSGWTFTAIGATYTTAGNFGAASPALTLDATGDRVLTNQLSGAAASQLSFWLKGNGTNSLSALLVEGTTDGTNWVTIENITNSIPTTGTTKTYNFSSTPLLPCGMIQFRFTYTKNAGNLAFDDVSITSASSTPDFVSGYNGLSVSGTSASVTGLTSSTTYYYRVRAVGTNSTSGNSNIITAATLNDPNTADYRSVASGNYTSSSTWEYNSIGSTWVAATQAPTSASNVNIQAAHTVTLDASRSIDSGKTLTIAGVLDAGANNISGAGVVAMAGTSTIITSSASGLAGALQVTTPSSCTFATGAKFHFTGTAVNTGFASFAGVGSFTFYNLVWAGTTSITLDKNIRITTLDFTNDGLFYLGNFDLYISSSGVINGSPFSSSKMFVTEGTGSLFRFITTGVWTAFTWPIGETSGTADYSPVTINALTGNAAASAYIGFRVTDSAEPNNGLASNYITRYWTYTTANLTAGSSWSNTTFGYTPSDIVGTETLLKANVYNAATTTWTEFSTSSAASNTLTFTSGASTTTVLTTNNITARVDPPLYYRSASSGSWGTASTWLVSTDASFVSPAGIAATSAPTAANSIGITILAGHSITSSASVSADQLTIQTGGSLEMTNNALTISNGTGTDVTVETGATLLLSGTSTMTINASAAIQVDGLYKVSSTSAPVVTTSGTTTIGAIGTYEHARDAGIIPTCTWTTGSTCLITGTGNNAPTGLAQSFHHFTVNTTLTNSVNCSGLLQTVNGKLKITTNNASFGWRLTGTTNYTLNVADSLIITNGILDVASGGATGTINASGPIVMNGSSSQLTKTGAAAMVINCNSNLVQNAGIIEFNAGGSSNTTWNIKGDVVQGGTIQRTNGGTHTLNFNKASGTQTWTQTGSFGSGALIINVGNSTTNTVQLLSNISLGASAHTFNVTNGATFNMGPYTLSGASSGFVLAATGAIKLGNVNGIVTAPTASGNVQTSTRTFPATASYFYNGTANQVTGNALPATLTTTGNLNIEAASGVTVTLTTNNTTVPTFNLLSGLFAAGTGQNINLSNGGVVNATGGDFATGASAGNITATGSAAFNGNCNPYNVYASGGVNFGAQTVSIQNGGTFRINAGGFVNTNAPYYSTGATLQYNSSATYGRALEWSATSGRGYPHHVQISNNTILDPANTAGAQANTPLRTAGNLTIDSGSAMYMDFGGNNMSEDLVVLGNLNLTGALSGSQASGSDIYVSGNWQNNGTSTNFYPNNRAVFFNGTGTQTISGTNSSFPAFPYLFIDKTAGAVSLSRDIQVTESLTFSSANTANIEANGFTVYVSKNTTTAIDRQGSGHVVGNLRRAVTTGTNTYAFPIGGTTAYAPVSMALNNVTVAGSLTLATTAGDHPQISTSGIDASKSVNRYYTITNTGVTLTSYNPTFTFVAGDLDASVNTSNLLVGRYNAGWIYPAIGTRTATSTQATTVTSFGDFAIAECKSPAAFNITGGGDYCSGGAGVAVGLDGSESWANYQLQRDGVDVGSPVTGTGSALSFGNQTAGGVYTAVALNVSSSSCSTAQTGTATISINPTVTPSVSIASTTSTSICSGSSVTFNATPQFGGTTPSYQWKLNGANVGTNASTYTNGSLVNNDVISCVMTSSEACPTSASVNSNTLTMTVLAYQTPTITVASTSGTTVCGGYEVIFTSSTTFAGLTPAYQWKINGVNAGGNGDTFSSTTLSSGDQVSCVLTSDYQCLTGNIASSNTLTMSVTAPPQVDGGSALSSCGTSPVVVSNGASVSSAVSYSWSENGAGSITAGGTTLTPTYTPAAGDVGTTVTLTLTANGNSPCAAVSDVVSVSITPLILFYVDADGDGFGNPLLAPVAACTAPAGRVANNTDCCDSNADVNPATEWWADIDGDGFGSFVANGGCISGCSGEAQNIPYYPAAHGGAPYVADCNDGNTTIYPGANELCQNSIDDDCDALIDEGCSGILNDTYANAVLTNTTNPNAIFPNCLVYNGTTLNADISPQANPANVASGGGRDVWYKFVAPSTAVRVRVVPVGFDAVLELRTAMPSNTQLDVENANATIGGVEILNKGGLTAGQTYYVAVRNYNATVGGSFTMCISPLMPSGCAYVVPTGGFSLCSTFKANYRGATSYTFNFTGTGGNAALPYVTTSASSTGLIALNTPALDLRNSGVYSCRVDANYILQDGAGATEPVITVLGSTTSSNCTGITISAQPQMVVRSNQVCPAVLNRSTFLVSVATDGSSQACGAINYTYRFTQVTDCSGVTTSGLPFTVNTTGTTPYLSLAAAFPASSGYPLASVGYWKVEVRPNFSYGAGTFGPSRIISVNNTSSTMAMDTEGFADSERSGDALNSSLGWNIYPNPSDGRSLQLQSPEESVIQMRIHNAVGALVYDAQISMQVQQPARVDFAQPLPAGVYLIELTTSNQTQTLRWVVE